MTRVHSEPTKLCERPGLPSPNCADRSTRGRSPALSTEAFILLMIWSPAGLRGRGLLREASSPGRGRVRCSTAHVGRVELANSGFSGAGVIGAARRRQPLGLNTPDRSSAFDQVLCL